VNWADRIILTYLTISSEHDVFVSTIIYHLLQVTQYNAQQMYEVGNWSITSGLKLNTLGLVINPSLSLVNHSCDPNAVRWVFRKLNYFFFKWRIMITIIYLSSCFILFWTFTESTTAKLHYSLQQNTFILDQKSVFHTQ